jgi:hypothetical protein
MKDRGPKSTEGALFFAAFAILILGGACAIWPPDFFHYAFADLPMGALIRAGASLVLAIGGLEFAGALAIVLLSDV